MELHVYGVNLTRGIALLLVVAAISLESQVVEGAKDSSERRPRDRIREDRLPLKAEKSPATSRGIPGCTFGGEYYELGEMWHPNLGDPFGEMVCVNCDCVAGVEDGKRVGKVRCRNVKSQCPEPDCGNEEPVLLPGACCKTCVVQDDVVEKYIPDDTNRPEVYGDTDEAPDEDPIGEVYVALLTGTLLSVETRAVARATFTLLENTLYFTINHKRIEKPTNVIFTDALNNTLFDHEVHSSSKTQVCGEWINVPQVYQRDLQNKQLFVTLITPSYDQGEVRGRITFHRAIAAESFSSMMIAERRPRDNDVLGTGGLMMLSIDKGGRTLNLALLLDGIIENTERTRDITLTIKLLKRSEVIQETQRSITPEQFDLVEVWSKLPKKVQKWLARGQLSVSVGVSGQNSVMSGPVTPLRTCNVLHAVLSGSQAMERPKATGASGSAILSIADDGTINYQIRITGTRTEVIGITIERASKNIDNRKIVADIYGQYDNGEAIGKYDRPKAREIDMLLHGELYINVATEAYDVSELRGRIVQLPYKPFVAKSNGLPVQLSGSGVQPPQLTGAAGHAWLVLDNDCALHYEIAVVGLNSDAVAKDGADNIHGFAEIGELDGDEVVIKRVLNAFDGNMASGVMNQVDGDLLERMNTGSAFIQVSTKNHQDGEIRGQVVLPNSCFTPGGRPNLPNLTPNVGYNPEADPDACFFEGRYRTPGSSWSPEYDSVCTTCTCQRRAVICDPVVCPVLTCSNPVTIQGDCCPVCPKPEPSVQTELANRQTEGCFFEGDKKLHRVGSQWHPFVPPFGYIKCAICTCMPGATVNCTRISCPKLTCDNPIRLNPMDCCQVCPVEPTPTPTVPSGALLQADEVERGCSYKDKFYRNGESWHPYVPPIGTMPCVTCLCKNGHTKCRRQTCRKLTCPEEEQIHDRKQCCARCKYGEANVVTDRTTTTERRELPYEKVTKKETMKQYA